MIVGITSTSILKDKATKRNVKNISKASSDIQFAIFQETMAELDNYLDTNDTRKLTVKSLGFLIDDVFQLIAGIRDLRFRITPGTVKSMDVPYA